MNASKDRALALLAVFGLSLGAVFGMAGTFATRPSLQASLWAIDGAGLVMATALLSLRFFRKGCDCVAAGFLVAAAELLRPIALMFEQRHTEGVERADRLEGGIAVDLDKDFGLHRMKSPANGGSFDGGSLAESG